MAGDETELEREDFETEEAYEEYCESCSLQLFTFTLNYGIIYQVENQFFIYILYSGKTGYPESFHNWSIDTQKIYI